MNRSPSLFPALIGLVGVLLGFALGALSCGPGPGAAGPSIGPALSPPGEDPNLAALLAEVRALGDRIAEMARARPVVAGPETKNERTPIDEAGTTTTTELTRLLEHCTRLVERLERRAGGAERRDLSLVTPGATRERFQEYESNAEGEGDRFTSDHLLWSYQQILDRYGPPDSIRVLQYSMYWRYDLALPDGDMWTRAFHFADGLVIRADR